MLHLNKIYGRKILSYTVFAEYLVEQGIFLLSSGIYISFANINQEAYSYCTQNSLVKFPLRMIFLNTHLRYIAESQYWSPIPYFLHVKGSPENTGQDKPEV